MDLTAILKNRKSCRKFSSQSISLDLIKNLIQVAQSAPNSCNLQTYHFLYIDDPEVLSFLAKNATGKVNWAPGLIIALNDVRYSVGRNAGLQSLAASINTMMIAAESFGLGTCWMAGFKGDQLIRERLRIPHYYDVSALVCIGYPELEVKSTRYIRPLEEVFSHNRYADSVNNFPATHDVRSWQLNQLMSYRRRLASVYGPRLSLNVYPEVIYEKSVKHFEGAIKKISLKLTSLIDVVTYDGAFIKKINHVFPNVDIVFTDYEEKFLEDLSKHLPYKNKLISKHDSNIGSDVATIIHKIEFHPNPSELFDYAYQQVRDGGLLYVMTISPYSFKAIFHKLSMLIAGKNVYEGNPYYKIGPFHHYKKFVLRQQLKKSGWKLIREKTYWNSNGFTQYELIAVK